VLFRSTRAAVLELAGALDLSPIETPLERGDLWRAQEAFLSNSLIGLRPLVEVDGKALGEGRPGPVTERLRKAYEKTLL
jgi:branched-subunit amino acid aminotransferase/4-amino-4-deoxychorismate lyase